MLALLQHLPEPCQFVLATVKVVADDGLTDDVAHVHLSLQRGIVDYIGKGIFGNEYFANESFAALTGWEIAAGTPCGRPAAGGVAGKFVRGGCRGARRPR